MYNKIRIIRSEYTLNDEYIYMAHLEKLSLGKQREKFQGELKFLAHWPTTQ